MAFSDNVKNHFKVGSKYIYHNSKRIATCIGFTEDTGCEGFHCDTHHKLGECDGSIKPVFDIFKNGHCAYEGSGEDWFKLVDSSNTRW